MTNWAQLTNSEKIAHNARVNAALIEYQALAAQVKEGRAWVGKNGPPAAPFGRETVETRNLSALGLKAEKAMQAYETLLAQYRA